MRGIRSQRILLIVGFFFLAVSSFHPINHIASDDQSEQIECQLCNNEASESVKIKTFENNYYLSSLLISGIEDKFISTLSKDFQSRAPPKI